MDKIKIIKKSEKPEADTKSVDAKAKKVLELLRADIKMKLRQCEALIMRRFDDLEASLK